MKIQIKARFTDAVMFECDISDDAPERERTTLAVEKAVSARAYLARANLDGAYLARANLDGANLARANLDGANLGGANLGGANLARAYLARANLARAYLARANLDGANLGGANLGGANLDGANLARANLDGAYLDGANLDGANLDGANLDGAKLIGQRPIIQIGPIGSRSSYLVAYTTNSGVMVKAGCWFGTLSDFGAQVIETHGGNEHAREYAAAIAMIEAHAAIWTPEEAAQEAK